MKEILIFIREHTIWLHYIVLEYKLLYIDLWSIIHFLSGAAVFGSLSTLKWKKRWVWLLFFLSMFEVIEATLFIFLLKLFIPEKIPDVFMDIIMGMAGGYLMFLLFEKLTIPRIFRNLIVVFIPSFTIAYIWTGNYGYEYNLDAINNQGINLATLLFWVITGMLILFIYHYFRRKFNKTIYAIGILYFIYFIFLMMVNYVTFNLFQIREISHSSRLFLCDFFEVNQPLIIFYLIAPITLILLDKWLFHISEKQLLYTRKNAL